MRKLKFKYVFLTIVLSGLVALCLIRWRAWFEMPPEPEWKGPVRDYVFPMFENDTTPQSFDMLVLGDIHSRLTTEDYNTLAERVPQADVIVQVGDWMAWGQNYYYQLLLQEWLPSKLFGMPVIATPGNHEYDKHIFKSCTEPWLHAFQFPKNGPVGVPGTSYYMDLPGIRLIAIDTNPIWRIVHLTRTLTWVKRLMRDAGGRYVVVIMHHPVHSAAKGHFNPLIYSTFAHALGRADLVIAGHDHSYMRRNPFIILNTAGNVKPQGGRLHAQKTETCPVYAVVTVQKPLLPDQRPELEFRTYRLSDGQLIDSLYVRH